MPIGIGIYWILGSVIQIIQTFFFDMHFSKIDVDELVRQNIEKASKKKNSGKKSYMQRMLDAQAELEQQREMSLKDYAKYMKAPHRMDLMISSMCEKGHWHCNQKCLHCYAGHQEYAIREELSTDEWKHIIDECKTACIPQLTFTGGEPTLRSDLVELVEYASWFVTRLNTNGILLSKELCKALNIKESPLYEITCGNETWFAYTEKEKADALEAIGNKKYTIQRSKGLGENDADMMNLTTMNPSTRRLIRVDPADAESTAEKFDLLLGDNLAGRKDYIANYGHLYIDMTDVS